MVSVRRDITRFLGLTAVRNVFCSSGQMLGMDMWKLYTYISVLIIINSFHEMFFCSLHLIFFSLLLSDSSSIKHLLTGFQKDDGRPYVYNPPTHRNYCPPPRKRKKFSFIQTKNNTDLMPQTKRILSRNNI